MRDRLIKILCGVKCEGGEEIGNCPQRRDGQCRTVQKLEMCQIGAITDHLLANGVIVPPVNVGQKVWYIHGGYYNSARKEPREIEITEINQKRCKKELEWAFIANGTRYKFSSIGKTVFLTRKEAERALKGEHHG